MIERVRDDIGDTADTVRNEMGALAWLLRTAVLAAVGGAIYSELRKPPGERTWEGRLLGTIPYDFRMPTPEPASRRLLESEEQPHLHRSTAGRRLGHQHPRRPSALRPDAAPVSRLRVPLRQLR